jgi:hypothetical protein
MNWIYLVLTAVLSSAFTFFILTRTVDSILQKIGIDDLSKELAKFHRNGNDTKNIAITIEQENGILFAYSKENPKFLAQGKTAEELLQNIGNRFIDVNITIGEHDKGYEILMALNNGDIKYETK